MSVTKEQVLEALNRVQLPNGETLISRDMIRAVSINEGVVQFVIEAPSPEVAAQMEPARKAAEAVVEELDGVSKVTVALTAHGPAAAKAPPPSLKIGGHPKPQEGQQNLQALHAFWRLGQVKAVLANPLSHPTLPSLWLNKAAKLVCWMQTFTALPNLG